MNITGKRILVPGNMYSRRIAQSPHPEHSTSMDDIVVSAIVFAITESGWHLDVPGLMTGL